MSDFFYIYNVFMIFLQLSYLHSIMLYPPSNYITYYSYIPHRYKNLPFWRLHYPQLPNYPPQLKTIKNQVLSYTFL